MLAKIASAGFVLALALVASLAVSGCGGGSSEAQTASAPGSSPSAAGSSQGKEKDTEGAGKAPSSAPGAPPNSSPGGAGGSAGANPGSGKHGTHIAPPKGPREPEPTPSEIAHATVADMALESPAIQSASGSIGALPATYTCDGKDSWPALRWAAIPPGTAELALFAMNVQPVEGKLFFDWALAGLDPGLGGIEADRLPKGAVVGQNSFGETGYSICPPEAGETYMFALFALPQRLSPRRGFDPHELRKEALGISGNVGLLPVAYARG